MHAATTVIYTLSLHDALPISRSAPRPLATRRASGGTRAARAASRRAARTGRGPTRPGNTPRTRPGRRAGGRSEEHTSELQSRPHLVCRLLLEKKKKKNKRTLT